MLFFSHGTHHSAGVAILFNKCIGDILETFGSDDDRCIMIVVKIDNSFYFDVQYIWI